MKAKIIKAIILRKFTFFDFFSNPLVLANEDFRKKYIKFLKWDIEEAKKGNLKSPYKKACDGVWRDLRPQITVLFDDCKNFKLYRYFLNHILSIHNRLCDGPSLEIIKRIKKLILKNVINLDFKNNYEIIKQNKSLKATNFML